uniref:Uncharacterized protein n=1 Tax=Rhizophora mucronata TaxID=61149 RepID=A0A2P2NY40_RHIMU
MLENFSKKRRHCKTMKKKKSIHLFLSFSFRAASREKEKDLMSCTKKKEATFF